MLAHPICILFCLSLQAGQLSTKLVSNFEHSFFARTPLLLRPHSVPCAGCPSFISLMSQREGHPAQGTETHRDIENSSLRWSSLSTFQVRRWNCCSNFYVLICGVNATRIDISLSRCLYKSECWREQQTILSCAIFCLSPIFMVCRQHARTVWYECQRS